MRAAHLVPSNGPPHSLLEERGEGSRRKFARARLRAEADLSVAAEQSPCRELNVLSLHVMPKDLPPQHVRLPKRVGATKEAGARGSLLGGEDDKVRDEELGVDDEREQRVGDA